MNIGKEALRLFEYSKFLRSIHNVDTQKGYYRFIIVLFGPSDGYNDVWEWVAGSFESVNADAWRDNGLKLMASVATTRRLEKLMTQSRTQFYFHCNSIPM